jgi:hypothetical protein
VVPRRALPTVADIRAAVTLAEALDRGRPLARPDERAAANNLGVTMNHLLGLLEPWRQRGEPSFWSASTARASSS